MAKNLKLNIKNTQIAKALNLDNLKDKLAKKKAGTEDEQSEKKSPLKALAKTKSEKTKTGKPLSEEVPEVLEKEEAPKIKARSRSVFAEPEKKEEEAPIEVPAKETKEPIPERKEILSLEQRLFKDSDELPPQVKKEVPEPQVEIREEPQKEVVAIPETAIKPESAPLEQKVAEPPPPPPPPPVTQHREMVTPPPVKLGPTGRHVKDLLPQRWGKAAEKKPEAVTPTEAGKRPGEAGKRPGEAASAEERAKEKAKIKPRVAGSEEDDAKKKGLKQGKFKEYKDIKPAKRTDGDKGFDYSKARQGLPDDENFYRKRRPKQGKGKPEETVIRPTSLSIRTPISIKDLASEMKLKASELIGKLFMQGLLVTLNDILEDETTIQLLGSEFGCDITLDNTEKKRIRITDKTIKEEVNEVDAEKQITRAPIVAFMGHVDHGKTSLIDAIRKSNRVAGEAGAITQHIGAFRCSTKVGDITVLDTPGHEAFSAMRARGADVTDIVVLVVAGDEGIKPQTVEALNHAILAKVTIVVALNKCDKPAFNAETVYRQLSEHELVPEAWGGQTITVNCSAVTGEGIETLLEMLALQSEVLELKAVPDMRARGIVLESEMHKGLGAKATVLVQNGTLRPGDAIVFGANFGRVKTMHDEHGANLKEALPSTPVEITGLSGLPDAGDEFIVVKDEKEAKSIADVRAKDERVVAMQRKAVSLEQLLEGASKKPRKVLNIIIRADVQGSLEALKTAIMKIESTKVVANIIFSGVGEITESDVLLANASNAVIIGFHTLVESHAEPLIKQHGIKIIMHDVIYHAIDTVRDMMEALLDKLAIETERGLVEVKTVFKSSQHGLIAGCQVLEGTITRNSHIRLIRDGELIWKGAITSLKRHKDDVKEVSKGFECGVLLPIDEIKEGDKLEVFEVTYQKQVL